MIGRVCCRRRRGLHPADIGRGQHGDMPLEHVHVDNQLRVRP